MTLPTLHTWPDFDDDGQPMSETVIGSDITPIAIVLAGEHHDAFLRLALAAPDLLAVLEAIIFADQYQEEDMIRSVDLSLGMQNLVKSAIAKAKGE